MNKTSLLKVIMFAVAIFANLNYLLFIINPAHADNLIFFTVTGIADTIAIIIFVSTWGIALYFELSKHRYYQEINDLRRKGAYLLAQRVAVLVPIVNEDLTIVRNTIESLQALHGDKTIYLLDDGKKAETKAFAAFMHVNYITRADNRFFKAGNLNNGLRSIPEEFFIVVDADFALHPEFISRTLPLFHDPKIAAVQTPQVYSNEETLFARGSRYLQRIFYTYIQAGRNLLDSSMCVGTNVIYRKSAVNEAGGIAEVSHSEDAFTTLKFMQHGYKVFYLDEELAVGLSPTTLISFFNQQFRWARGGFSMMLKHNTLLNNRLNIEQRIQFFFSNFFYLSGISIVVYLVSPLLVILFDVKPLNNAYFWEWLPRYALFFCTNFVFFMTLIKKNRLDTLLLGMFSFVPYVSAFISILLNRGFHWKPTNARSKGTITKILTPYILYIAFSLASLYFLLTGVINFDQTLIEYYVWGGIDVIIAAVFIVHSYRATSYVTIPVFENVELPSMPQITGVLHAIPQQRRTSEPVFVPAMGRPLLDTHTPPPIMVMHTPVSVNAVQTQPPPRRKKLNDFVTFEEIPTMPLPRVTKDR